MRKMPTIFERDRETGLVMPVVNPAAAWVFDPEVPKEATRKWDGTCVMFDGDSWYARREVKPGKAEPPNFTELGLDEVTGKRMGWEPMVQSGWAKYHAEAVNDNGFWQGADCFPPGTYELIGPKVNGNPEKFTEHWLVKHADAGVIVVPEVLTFESVREYLRDCPYEGVVWHETGGGRMAKVKRKDFFRGK